MHSMMKYGDVLPGDGYATRKPGNEASISLKSIARCGGMDEIVQRLVVLYQELENHHRANGKGWFRVAHQFAVTLAETFDYSVWQTSQVIAVLSPQNPWDGAKGKDGNRKCSLKAIQAYRTGGHDALFALKGWGYAPAFLEKVEVVLSGGLLDWTTAHKTYRFAQQIFDPDIKDIAVIDSHTSRICLGNLGDRYHVVSNAAYLPLEECVRRAAVLLGIDMDDLQASLWEAAVSGKYYNHKDN